MSSPTVVGLAIPHIVKSNDKKLVKNPDNATLRFETGSYYVIYANAFVQGPAQMLPPSKYEKRDSENRRAKALYLRGVEILRDGLDKKYPGINDAYAAGKMDSYLKRLTKDDVPTIYFLVGGTLSAFSIDPMDVELGLKLRELTMLIKQAYTLDPDYGNGTLDDFFVLFNGGVPPALGGDPTLVGAYFDKAIAKSKGLSATPYVSWAETIAIPSQNYASFKENLEKALAVDINKSKNAEDKLANKLAQKKARYLLKNAPRFFIIPDEDMDS
jgi:predicted anti-sigma-YlaC factor YlaD